MHLAEAEKLAEKITAQLAPFCERLEIAGSIRRRREWVNDIDLVALPKPGQLEAFRERVTRHTTPVISGAQNLIVRLGSLAGSKPPVQLDIFIAQPAERDLVTSKPGNFGSLLLCRTGSKEHNVYLVQYAKPLGLTWNPYHGVYDGHGHCLASETEQDIFAALTLDFVPPEKREK